MYKQKALRRWNTYIKQVKAVRVVNSLWWDIDDRYGTASKLRDNMAICSCYMCRNPRHNDWAVSEQLTLAERRSIDIFNDWKNEYINERISSDL